MLNFEISIQEKDVYTVYINKCNSFCIDKSKMYN